MQLLRGIAISCSGVFKKIKNSSDSPEGLKESKEPFRHGKAIGGCKRKRTFNFLKNNCNLDDFTSGDDFWKFPIGS